MRYAVVTGATSGIGLAIAQALLKEGGFVFLNYAHDDDRAKRVCEQLGEYKGRFELLRLDMTEYASVGQLVALLQKRGIHLDDLVLNAGLTDRTAFGEVTPEGWERVMRANVNVPFFLIQSLYNAGLFSDNASVLCIGSLMGSIPHSVSVSYGVSKAATSALSRNLVKFLAPRGIRINTVEPGFVDTPWQKAKPPQQRQNIEAKTALGRFAQPQEVADICLAVLRNGFLTGAVIPVDGGYGLQ